MFRAEREVVGLGGRRGAAAGGKRTGLGIHDGARACRDRLGAETAVTVRDVPAGRPRGRRRLAAATHQISGRMIGYTSANAPDRADGSRLATRDRRGETSLRLQWLRRTGTS